MNKAKLRYMMIKEFKDKLTNFKKILNEREKLGMIGEKELNKIKKETKRKLNMLDDEIIDILEKLDENLTTLELRCRFCKKSYDFEKEIELRLSAKEKINEIERLKEDVKNQKDEFFNIKTVF